jgi:hypothetical protein
MFKYVPAIESSIFLIIIFSINLLLLKKLLKNFDKNLNYKKNLKKFIILVFVVSFFIFLGMSLKIELLLKIFVLVNLFLIFANLSFLLSLPFMLIYLKVISILERKIEMPTSDSPPNNTNLTRREFIKKGVAIFPLLTITTSSIGIFEGFSPTNFKKVNLSYKNLPESFNGLKIAQISDLHLGFFVRINDLKKITKKLDKLNLDLLLITGDFVDDYIILDEAIELVKNVKTKYGIYASIGNHEYFRGIEPVIKAFKKAEIPLLINDNVSIEINSEKLFIGGVDDPRRLHGDINIFLENALKQTLKKSKNESFKIIMSHRPNILPLAAKNNINLVLSGHTHGGQFGFNNRSIFESQYPKSYLWGKYAINETQLYTSSGAGHWFPFRIGCPTEVPIITLSR